MATREIEKKLTQILNQVRSYQSKGQLEELTYLVGAGMATLEQMGCPIQSLRLQTEEVVDRWANSKQAPARSQSKQGGETMKAHTAIPRLIESGELRQALRNHFPTAVVDEIVHAVNLHEELVECLKRLEQYVNHGHADGSPAPDPPSCEMCYSWQNLRLTLAKAKEAP